MVRVINAGIGPGVGNGDLPAVQKLVCINILDQDRNKLIMLGTVQMIIGS